MGALAILLIGFGWAKPVNVNPRYFKNYKRDMAITAFAGPLSNLILAFISLFFFNFFLFLLYNYIQSMILVYVCLFFEYVALINIGLAVFNLIRIPPLDGSKILAIILPDTSARPLFNLRLPREESLNFKIFFSINTIKGFKIKAMAIAIKIGVRALTTVERILAKKLELKKKEMHTIEKRITRQTYTATVVYFRFQPIFILSPQINSRNCILYIYITQINAFSQ